jgi:streptogramin lyase
MKRKILILLTTIALLLGWQVEAQNYDTNGDYVQTFVGSQFSGYLDGVGQSTMFNGPAAIVADSHSNLFVWDNINIRIREITPSGTVSTFAGGGSQSTGVGTNANLNLIYSGLPTSMTIDHNDTIWMVNPNAQYLYKITSDAMVAYTNLSVSRPYGICADSHNNIYISGFGDNKIYRYNTNGVLSVFAGSGNPGNADGNGIFTAFYNPTALAADAADDIYVWDWSNSLIRRIDQSQNVTTFAGEHDSNVDGVGTNVSFIFIYQMCFDNSGNLYLACGNGGEGVCIRKIDAATNVVTLAGSFTQTGYTNGAGNLARFNGAGGVCISGGTIFVADSVNERIRSITNNPTAQVVSPANLELNTYPGLQIIGTVGRTYQIQTSPDLNSWSTKATILLNSSPYIWIDQNPVSGNKFYRAVLLP